MSMGGSEAEAVRLLENATAEAVSIRRAAEKNARQIVQDARAQADLVTAGAGSIRGAVLDGFRCPVPQDVMVNPVIIAETGWL